MGWPPVGNLGARGPGASLGNSENCENCTRGRGDEGLGINASVVCVLAMDAASESTSRVVGSIVLPISSGKCRRGEGT